jgi:glutamyl-tRNA reductase
MPLAALRELAEERTGQAVVEHLFRVTAGLDSRVVGEVEVQGQVQSAFRAAHAAGLTGPALGQLFPAALRCGREVRERTTLGAQGRSLARRAVEVGLASLAGAGRTRPAEPVVLVVGSGHMATTAVEHLHDLGHRAHVAARDVEHAERLAGPGFVCPLPDLAAGVARADVLICATSADRHVVTVADVGAATRGRVRPLTVVDLSVPRNVDVSVGALPGVLLIDMEGMNDDATRDPAVAAALATGAAIVRAATRTYVEGSAARQAGPVIAALRRQVGEASTARLLHRATVTARAAAVAGDTATLRLLCELFDVPLADAGLPEQRPSATG